MPRNVVVGAYQAQWEGTKDKMIDKHAEIVKDAAKKGVQILCFQELFLGNIGVYICYDRHFPEGVRILGLMVRQTLYLAH
jgi:predicted amidohydrolase